MAVLVRLRFIGTLYHGWQVQANALSVQQVFQDAVEKVYGARLPVIGCSRTDTGVHANEYCVSFLPCKQIPTSSVPSALNMYLPDDMAVTGAEEVPDDFHARYSAVGKEYVYLINNAPQRDPFLFGRALHWKWKLDEAMLDECALAYIGTHDFSAFCSAGSDIDDKVRTIVLARVERDGDIVRFRVRGDGFLYNMVRIMTGTLLKISMGGIDPGEVPDIIESKDRARAGFTAVSEGLYLNRVFYNDNEFRQGV